MSEFDTLVSQNWPEIRREKSYSSSLLTVFLCLAASVKPKTSLSERDVSAIVRKLRKAGIDSVSVLGFIKGSAPYEMKEELAVLWEEESSLFYPGAGTDLLTPILLGLKDKG